MFEALERDNFGRVGASTYREPCTRQRLQGVLVNRGHIAESEEGAHLEHVVTRMVMLEMFGVAGDSLLEAFQRTCIVRFPELACRSDAVETE